MRKAFTLIELLVVIAIIAILASILFPVFAQAKETAKRIVCVSNLKNLSMAFMMYGADNDDGLPTQNNTLGDSGEFQVILQPYIKNREIFYCPSRRTKGCDTSIDPSGRCLGYAPNFGIYSYHDGLGIFEADVVDPMGGSMWVGRNLGEFSAPSEAILAGDTNDTNDVANTRMYTLSFYWQLGDGSTSAAIRHNGQYQFAYIDGHAKNMRMGAYSFYADNDAFTIMPQNGKFIRQYCYNQDVASNRVGSYYGAGIPCGQLADNIARDRVPL